MKQPARLTASSAQTHTQPNGRLGPALKAPVDYDGWYEQRAAADYIDDRIDGEGETHTMRADYAEISADGIAYGYSLGNIHTALYGRDADGDVPGLMCLARASPPSRRSSMSCTRAANAGWSTTAIKATSMSSFVSTSRTVLPASQSRKMAIAPTPRRTWRNSTTSSPTPLRDE